MIRVVRLGSPRRRGEGPRLGTVRRLPRGVKKSDYAKLDYFDFWLPELAPSDKLVAFVQKDVERNWKAFARRYRAEMAKPPASRTLAVLAALSRQADFSLGCYCENEDRCHRSLLRQLLKDHGGTIQ